MQTLKKAICELILPCLMAWFFMTVLVDIVAIPTVFRNSSNLKDAGKIGMVVFGRFNYFEIFFATTTFLGAWLTAKKGPGKRKYLYFALPLFFLSLLYTFYMTPTITELTYAIHRTDVQTAEYAVLQAKHAEVHNFYRFLDGVKLITLLIFSGWVLKDAVLSNRDFA